MHKIKVKICCISSEKEAKTAIDYGASALGLVGKMPSGPGVVKDEMIKAIARIIPPPVASFLLTSEVTATEIIAHHHRTATNTIQLVDRVPVAVYTELRAAMPAIKIVQVIHVLDESSVEEAAMYAAYADALLLDSGNPNLSVKQLGGTGRVHDWSLSRKIVDQVPVPVFLAGGLHSGNIAEALTSVHPFGVDICSGVRSSGLLDEEKLYTFMRQAGY